MNFLRNAFMVVPVASMVMSAAVSGEDQLKHGDLLAYQAKPMEKPRGGEKFAGSNFIHPLKTPSGFVVTGCQPLDHMHHFGLWWPWKYVKIGKEKVLFWELQRGEGVVQAIESEKTETGFKAKSHYIDKKSGDQPKVVIEEAVECKVAPHSKDGVDGYDLDLKIDQQVVGEAALEVVKYRYSGFTYRGTAAWNKDTSKLLTSEGKTRKDSNDTTAKWVWIEGEAKEGKKAGVLMMSAPTNYNHPEPLRTWNDMMVNGALFVNFNPVQNEAWKLEPGKTYTRNYRVYVYDGSLTEEKAEALWKRYAETFED